MDPLMYLTVVQAEHRARVAKTQRFGHHRAEAPAPRRRFRLAWRKRRVRDARGQRVLPATAAWQRVG